MKTKHLLAVSAALNLALGAMLLVPARQKDSEISHAAESSKPPEATTTAPPTNAAHAPASQDFHWSWIACEDLKRYRDNLRGMQCPEQTTREIILAEINHRFEPRRRALLNEIQNRFWNLDVILELADRKSPPREEWFRPLQELATERQHLIDQVLGPDRGSATLDRQARRSQFQQDHTWLSESRCDALFNLEEEHAQRLAQWNQSLSRRNDGILSDADNARREAIDRWFADSQQRLLTPDELNELRLRDSDAAHWASDIPGFEATEPEWRAVVTAQLALREDGSTSTPGENETPASNSDDRHLQAIEQALGPDRFAQYQLAMDSAYQAVHGITQRYELSDTVTAQALELQRAAQSQAAQIRGNTTLTEDQRHAALSAIATETERHLSETLGAQAFCTYKEYDGDWLSRLTSAEKSP